jgi:hypothetical protein
MEMTVNKGFAGGVTIHHPFTDIFTNSWIHFCFFSVSVHTIGNKNFVKSIVSFKFCTNILVQRQCVILLGLVVRPGSNDTVWVSHTILFAMEKT